MSLADGFVEVKFKPETGKEDQAGGVVWRWKDGDNYYVARANALENNMSLYYTVNGRRNTHQVRRRAGAGECLAHAARRVLAARASGSLLDGKPTSSSKTTTSAAPARSACGRRPTA